jgi:hypothetical protein
MMVIEAATPEAHPEALERLMALDDRGSRIGGMREELGAVVVSDDPRRRYLFRDETWNLAFQLQEHWAYWAGANPGHVERYNTNMETWIDEDTGELPGSAYGDRLRNTAGHDQIGRALRQLRESPETRRAMMMVHQPSVEAYSGEDVACTAYLHPFIRDGDLHMIAAVRSQDMHWGYPYDAANNQFVQEAMAVELGVGLGEYVHFMDSCHYYTDFEEEVRSSVETGRPARGLEIDLPEWRSWGEEFGHLTAGLEAARGFDLDEVLDSLDRLESGFAMDWLEVMAAYELTRYHDGRDDSEQLAEQFAARVDSDDWRAWIRGYAGLR